MNREFLRGLGVTEDIIPQIINQHHDALRPLREKTDKADELQQTIDGLNEELKNRDTQLNALQEKAKDNEDLNAELEKYKQQNEQKTTEIKQLQLNNAIKVEALKHNVVDADAFIKLVDTSKVKLNEDGTFEGLDSLITESTEKMPYLFTDAKPLGKPLPVGGQPQAMTREQIMKVEDRSERQRLIKENLDLFQ